MSRVRNTAYNLLGSLSPMLVALVTVPLYIKYIGAAEYGILTIAWLLMGYSTYAEFGLGQSVANEIARLGEGRIAERNAVFWTGFWPALFFGLLLGFVIVISGTALVPAWTTLEPKLRVELVQALPWLMVAAPLSAGNAVLVGAMDGRQHFKHSNIIQSIGWVVSQGLPLLGVLMHRQSLPWLLALATFGRAFTFLSLFGVLSRLLPLTGKMLPERSRLSFLLGFGGWVTLSNVAESLLSSLDRWLAGGFLGAKAVAYYGVPANLAQRTSVFPVALVRTLFPRFSAMDAELALRETVRTTIYLGRIFAPMMGAGIILIDPFLRLWVGRDFAANAYSVAPILFLTAWIRALSDMPDVLLRATRRPRTVASVRVIELPLLFIAGWFGFRLLGLPGLAWAWCLRVTFDAAWLWSRTGCLMQVAGRLVPQAIGLTVIYLLMQDAYRPFSPAAFTASSCVVVLLMIWTLWMDRNLWAQLWLAVRRKSVPR
ncbi:MAG TPA: flippase [Gammaproteobacteria bacterium]|nr:flippase [Gammaproteobacteria bacterium]